MTSRSIYPLQLISSSFLTLFNGLYPPPTGSILQEYGAPAGASELIKPPSKAAVTLLDVEESSEVEATPLTSSIEEEILVSDKLASKLRISRITPPLASLSKSAMFGFR